MNTKIFFVVEPLFSAWKVFSVYSLLRQHRLCLQLCPRSLAHCLHSPFSTDSTVPLTVLRLYILTNTITAWQTDLCNMDRVYEYAWEITSPKRNFVMEHKSIAMSMCLLSVLWTDFLTTSVSVWRHINHPAVASQLQGMRETLHIMLLSTNQRHRWPVM